MMPEPCKEREQTPHKSCKETTDARVAYSEKGDAARVVSVEREI